MFQLSVAEDTSGFWSQEWKGFSHLVTSTIFAFWKVWAEPAAVSVFPRAALECGLGALPSCTGAI